MHQLLIKCNNQIFLLPLISTSLQLENYLKVIKDESKLAIDTEFKRIETYYPELCLIQIATSNSIECIDVLAIKDLEPLFKKLYDKKTSWIVHSARQDIEALFFLSKRAFGTGPRGALCRTKTPRPCNCCIFRHTIQGRI